MLNFVEPAPSAFLISLIQLIWPIYTRMKFGSFPIKVSKGVQQAFKLLKDQPTIICPNHSASEDSDALFGLSKIIGEHFYFLTARELFGANDSLKLKILQKLGCYSIERGMADFHAFRATLKLLIEGKNKIVIFPEGEVSHRNEFLIELENGVEHMALSAAEKFASMSTTQSIYLLPLFLKYKYMRDIRQNILSVMSRIEVFFGQAINTKQPLKDRLKQAYEILLENLEKAHELENTSTDFDKRLFFLRQKLINEVQSFLQVDLPDNYNQLSQIHILKNVFTEIRWGNIENKKHKWLPDDIDKKYYQQLRLATSLIALGSHSFDHDLPQEDAAELVSTLEQEICQTFSLREPKKVLINAGNIINVSHYLTSFQKDKRAGVEALKLELKEQLAKYLHSSKNDFLF